MPKERRRRHHARGAAQDDQQQAAEIPPSTLPDGREGAALIERCEVEDETQREDALTTLATLLAGSDRAALVNQPRLGPMLLERINDGSLGVRVAALAALRNLLLDESVPALSGDPTPLVLKSLAVGLRPFLNIQDEQMPKLPTLAVPLPAAAAVPVSGGNEEEQHPKEHGEPGFDKAHVEKLTRLALAAHAAEVLAALTTHSETVVPQLLAHEGCALLLRAIHATASLPAPGEAELECALARLALHLADSPSELQQAGAMLSEALAPCVAAPATRYALETRTAFAAAAALLLAEPATAPPLVNAGPAILIALSDAMQHDAIALRTTLLGAMAAAPPEAIIRGTEEAEAHLLHVIRAQNLALEAVANMLVSEDSEAAPDTESELQDNYVAPAAHAPTAAAAPQYTQPYLAMQAQLVASPLLLTLIARKCVLAEAPPANLAADMRNLDEAFMGLLGSALDALLNYLLSEAVPMPAPATVAELWNHLCLLGGQLVARNLNALLPSIAQCLAALARRPGVTVTPTESQLDGLLAFAGSSVDTVAPFAIELLALFRRILGPRMATFGTIVMQLIEAGQVSPPASLSAALNATYDTFADDFAAPDALLASLQRLYPVLTQRLREQRRTMDPNEWEHLDEARINLRRFLQYKGVR